MKKLLISTTSELVRVPIDVFFMKQFTSILAIILQIVSCGKRDTPTSEAVHKEVNSVYYWKTSFELDSTAYEFLKLHGVGRLYLRMFDVVRDEYGVKPNERSVPNATVRIDHTTRNILEQDFKDMEIVPVVYITLEALKEMK